MVLIPVRGAAPVDSSSNAAASARDCGCGGTPLAAVFFAAGCRVRGFSRVGGFAGWRVVTQPTGLSPDPGATRGGVPSPPCCGCGGGSAPQSLPSDLPSAAQNGNTALMKAAYKGHLEVVKQLLEAGADKDVQDKVQPRGLRARRVGRGRPAGA